MPAMRVYCSAPRYGHAARAAYFRFSLWEVCVRQREQNFLIFSLGVPPFTRLEVR